MSRWLHRPKHVDRRGVRIEATDPWSAPIVMGRIDALDVYVSGGQTLLVQFAPEPDDGGAYQWEEMGDPMQVPVGDHVGFDHGELRNVAALRLRVQDPTGSYLLYDLRCLCSGEREGEREGAGS